MTKPKCTNLTFLQSVVEDMDATSQGAFSQISTLASLALESVETTRNSPDLLINRLQDVLEVIQFVAESADGNISSQAEHVGCGYVGSKR